MGLYSSISPNSLGRKLLYLVAAFAALFIVNFLAYNYLLRQLDRTAAAVDAAGRQRMLSQKIAYTALLASAAGEEKQLRRLASDFEETLLALRHGGFSRNFFVHPAPAAIVPLLDHEEELWQDYRDAALDLAASRHGSSTAKSAIARIEAGTEPLLAACDAVTEAFRLHAQRATRRMNRLMMTLDAVALLLGTWAVYFAFTRVTNPIVAISGAARDLAAGRFTATGAENAGGEIGALSDTFSGMARRIGRDMDRQSALNSLLSISAEHGSLNDLLGRLLETLLEIPWLRLQAKGAVFLRGRDGNLKMAASRGLAPEILESCANVASGHCLCGRASATGEAVFAADADERHETRYEGMAPHGHYCLPIKTSSGTGGVLTLYLDSGHAFDPEEKTFLDSAAALMGKAIEYKELEAKATQAQKMESLGKAAGAVAHDFNNILTAIKGFNELVRDAVPPDSEAARYAKEAAAGIDRGADLVKQVLAFSRAGSQELEKLDLAVVVGDSSAMLSMVLGRAVKLELALPEGLPPVLANKGQLNQVLMNLAVNAKDAMHPKGGILKISASGDKNGVRLEVADTGCGIPPEVLERIFDPFFTTKPEGAGTGLGLSTVYSIVKSLKGDISVASAPGAGTVFTITLPATPAAR